MTALEHFNTYPDRPTFQKVTENIFRERRRGTRREASRRSTQRASCHSHMGKQKNIITGEILILAMWCMEQKVILFRCRTDIRDEPARPDPARP